MGEVKHDMPREKLQRLGASALKDYELMAVLLGTGVKGKDVIALSKELIQFIEKEFDSLDLKKLLSIHGLGSAKASQILSALELSKRLLIESQNIKITTPKDIYEELRAYRKKQQEYFIALYLDGANCLLETKVITIGTLNQSLVHPREIFSYAIEKRCASIIIAHNHPSSILSPTKEDLDVTQRLQKSAKILGIELLDHVIFTKEGFYSFDEEGLL